MNYTIILDEGLVIRDFDGKIVSPCQSMEHPDFKEYQDWIAAGNGPTILQTRQ
jgi:hypothetical protein